MTFRNLTNEGDWVWGTGKNSYVSETQEIALNIKTRVLSFLNDCFFATNEGIDYWNLLDYNKQEQLENQIQSTIIQTPGVTKINQVEVLIGANRRFNVNYNIETIYSTIIDNTLALNNV